MEKKRLDFIDTCKFICIFLVTFCHIKERGTDIAWIYSFHLPVFYVLAGFTLNVEMSFKDYLYKKCKSYLIPLFFMDILCIIVAIGFALYEKNYGMITPNYFASQIGAILEQRRYCSLWFVASLFVAVLFAYPICKAGKKHKWIIIFTSAVSLALAIFFNKYYNGILSWNIDASFFGVFFIAMGYLLRSVCNKIPALIKNRGISLIFALLFLYIGFTFVLINYKNYGLHLEMWGRQYQKYHFVIPGAVFVSFGIIFFSNVISNPVFAHLGKGNIVVLALQQDLGMRLWKNYLWKDYYKYINTLGIDSSERYYYALMGTLFTLAISYVIYYIFAFTPLAFCINQKRISFKKKKEVMI